MAVDVHFDKRVLLLHFDGSNGSTTFTDSSRYGHTCTAVGNAQITTAQSVFGGASGDLDGTGDAVDVAYSSDLNLAGGDWCIEARVRANSGSGQVIIDFRGSGGSGVSNQGWAVYVDQTARSLAIFDATAGTTPVITPSNTVPVSGTFYGIAVSQQSGVTRLFIDGTLQASTSGFTTRATHSSGLRIGMEFDGDNAWNGQIDELRITKGRAERTASYTLDGSAFSDERGGWVQADGPLQTPALFGLLDVAGHVLVAGPLAQPSLLGFSRYGLLSVAGPLGQPAIFGRLVFGYAAAPSVLGGPALVGFHDFTAQVDINSRTTYVMDLVTPGGLVRVPISSWQSTIHADEASYLQCVIPAVTPWIAALETATSFVVSRRATLTTGTAYEYPMASAPTQTISLDQSGRRHTATVSGYSAPFATLPAPVSSLNRTLEKVRLSSSTSGRRRVQCAIDWLLQPGQNAVLDGEPFEVAYINYFCNTDSESMVVGEAEA